MNGKHPPRKKIIFRSGHSKNCIAANRARAGESGAIGLLAYLMRRYINNLYICNKIFNILNDIALDGKSLLQIQNLSGQIYFHCADANKVRARALGVIDLTVRIMNKYIEKRDICRDGCNILWSLAVNGINKSTWVLCYFWNI